MAKKVLIIGACGQIGTELTVALRDKMGADNVIASDIRDGNEDLMKSGPFEALDATDKEAVERVINDHEIDDVYLMAAMLSAKAEEKPMAGWHLNMEALFNMLNMAKANKIGTLFWPSSIAVFGPNTPKEHTPQSTIMDPTTVYGISKLAGERWCAYYHEKYGADIRSLRYPGLISYKSPPGGGTTDYAVEIFHKALESGDYTCFLRENRRLPMMFMDDAIRATKAIMEAPAQDLSVHSSYNLAGLSFTPRELADNVGKEIPGFSMDYAPDFRDAIAESWPSSIDDTPARQDWNWEPEFDMGKLTQTMLKGVQSYSH